MNALSTPATLRPQVIQRIEQLSDAELAEVDRFLLQLEAERLMDSVCDAMDDARTSGKMGDVESSIRAYRQQKPYQ
ncbi:MAG: hypothetical protein Q8M07_29895 [Prosthecobacter sp.]|nr:hypothetical protein [Prosthecobacter sp.]